MPKKMNRNSPTGRSLVTEMALPSVTFAVDDVTPAKNDVQLESRASVLNYKESRVIDSSPGAERLYFSGFGQPLLEGIEMAWKEHRHLVLSPDMFWMRILRSCSQHINQDPERFRDLLVWHPGLMEVEVPMVESNKHPGFDWAKIIASLTDQVSQNSTELVKALAETSFTTTGPIERTVHNMTILGSMRSYCKYVGMLSICGIPSVTLEGTAADWQALVDRTAMLRPLGLDWWLDDLLPVLQKMADSITTPDLDFWKGIYKYRSGDMCGDPSFVDGWILQFYPFLASGARTDRIGLETNLLGDLGNDQEEVPFTLRTRNLDGSILEERSLTLVAGALGLQQVGERKALRPELGWLVKEAKETDTRDADCLNYTQVLHFPPELLKADGLKMLELDGPVALHIPEGMKAIRIGLVMLKGPYEKENYKAIAANFHPKTVVDINGEEVKAGKPSDLLARYLGIRWL